MQIRIGTAIGEHLFETVYLRGRTLEVRETVVDSYTTVLASGVTRDKARTMIARRIRDIRKADRALRAML